MNIHRAFKVSILLASFVALTMSSAASLAGSPMQVFAERDVIAPEVGAVFVWTGFEATDRTVVPPKKILEITSATFNYFSADTGFTMGLVALDGRNALGSAVWRQQAVYVHEFHTLQLTFPLPLLLEEGGHVEVSFPGGTGKGGVVFVSLVGHLVDK